ncbi:hypothetical protein U2446_15100, partial [Listeria monocytogenes]|uniref:hypothetical protein n=1 Tax=Listeria monocytogenes TaxID=1639 RepID=UPI002FDBA130
LLGSVSKQESRPRSPVLDCDVLIEASGRFSVFMRSAVDASLNLTTIEVRGQKPAAESSRELKTGISGVLKKIACHQLDDLLARCVAYTY